MCGSGVKQCLKNCWARVAAGSSLADWLQVIVAAVGLFFVWWEISDSADALRMNNDYEVHKAITSALDAAASSDAFLSAFANSEVAFDSTKVIESDSIPLAVLLSELRVAKLVFLEGDNDGLSQRFWELQVEGMCAVMDKYPNVKTYWEYRTDPERPQPWDRELYDEISSSC